MPHFELTTGQRPSSDGVQESWFDMTEQLEGQRTRQGGERVATYSVTGHGPSREGSNKGASSTKKRHIAEFPRERKEKDVRKRKAPGGRRYETF